MCSICCSSTNFIINTKFLQENNSFQTDNKFCTKYVWGWPSSPRMTKQQKVHSLFTFSHFVLSFWRVNRCFCLFWVLSLKQFWRFCSMPKRTETTKGWPSDEEHWGQWLPKNYGKLYFSSCWRESRWSGDRSEIDIFEAEILLPWSGDR